jgi:signal transduction histidine kinase
MHTNTEPTSGKDAEGRENADDNNHYRQAFGDNRTIQLLIDPETWAIVDANPAAAEFYGYTLPVLKQLDISAINTLPPEQLAEAIFLATFEHQPLFFFRHRLASGCIREVEERFTPVVFGGRRLLFSIVYDVAGQQRGAAAPREQTGFGTLVATMSRLVRDLPPEEIDSGIHQALRAIGEFVSVDRSYLYLFSETKTPTIEAGYEWCAPGVAPELSKTVALAMGACSWSRKQIQEHEVLHIPRIVDLPLEANAEKLAFAVQGVQSALIVPLFSGGLLGFLGCDVVRAEKTWSEENIMVLKVVREILVQTLQRKRFKETEHRETEVSAALARAGQELIPPMDTTLLLERVCQLTVEVLQCENSHVFLRQADGEKFMSVASFGEAPERRATVRSLDIPTPVMQPLLERLEREDAVHVTTTNAQELLLEPLLRLSGRRGALYLALRYGKALFGVLSAGYRTRPQPFSPQQQRLARGLAQFASLVLGNARLLEEMERVNRLKTDFLATMSHELRTPLSIIIGYIDMLLEGDCGELSAAQSEFLRRIGSNANELFELISATLDISRFEAGRLPIELREVELTELMTELQQDMANRIIKPGVTVEWRAPSLPFFFHTDRAKLKVIVKNLLGNALKFTEQGTITVEAHPLTDGVEMTVSDTGIGIPAEILPVIFDMFRQGDSATARRYGGVGLGLYIVRRLLDLLGGTVSVESTMGRGSTFRVWAPNRQ